MLWCSMPQSLASNKPRNALRGFVLHRHSARPQVSRFEFDQWSA
jgi:hypothetical protein